MDYKSVLYKYSYFENETGRVINLSTLNQIFFGNSDPFCISGKLELINTNLIVKINDVFYLNINKVDEYFEKIDNFDNLKFFPYNYYKFFKITKISTHFKNMIESIDKYIDYLTKINNSFSINIKHIIFNNNLLNADLIIAKDDIYIIKFNKRGKPLIINFIYNLNATGNYLFLDNTINELQYENTFNFHKEQLLMEDPENFLITNMERVTGNKIFSEMAVKSYIYKDIFNTPIEGLCELVQWKNKTIRNNFIKLFIEKYPNLVKSDTMTNFEGFNKFLLNIDTNYVNWQIKEQINELYYQITYELIRSFELLYINK
jgi:hypothetical protein